MVIKITLLFQFKIGERKVIEMKSEGPCRDFGHDSIMSLDECKLAAKAVGKEFKGRREMTKLPEGCLGYRYKAYYNEIYRHPSNKRSPRNKRSINTTQQELSGHQNNIYEDNKHEQQYLGHTSDEMTIRPSRVRLLRKRKRYRYKGVLHICYEKKGNSYH